MSLDLDKLFGNTFDQVVSERPNPYKVCIYMLLRGLQEVQTGANPFSSRQISIIYASLYGLIERGNGSFLDVRRTATYLDTKIRPGILTMFNNAAERLMNGEDVSILASDPMYVERSTDIDSRSYFSIWGDKMVLDWRQMSVDQMFELNKATRRWMKADDEKENGVDIAIARDVTLNLRDNLPIEIHTSLKARTWLQTQMHLLQLCPSTCAPEPQLYNWCDVIEKNFKDSFQVHMVMMMLHVRKKNFPAASESLRRFLDYSMFRVNDSIGAVSNVKMGVPAQRAARYGPLLSARLCRIFEDKETARHLLCEAVAGAQQHRDVACLRLALVELAAIETMPPNNAELYLSNRNVNTTNHMLTSKGLMRMIIKEKELDDTEYVDAPPVDSSDRHMIRRYLLNISQLVTAVSALRTGHLNSSALTSSLDAASRCSLNDDLASRARLICDASEALRSSVRLANGLWKVARSGAQSLCDSNHGDGKAPRFETDSQAIAGVNIVYSMVAEGEWSAAQDVLDRLFEKYPENINWMAWEHVRICRDVIRFDNSFRFGKWTESLEAVECLMSTCRSEGILRRAHLLAQRGSLHDACSILEKERVKYHTENTTVIYLRMCMQLAVFWAAEKQWEVAEHELLTVEKESSSKGLNQLAAMARRRIAVVKLLSGVGDVGDLLESCSESISETGSMLERALHLFTIAKYAKQGERDDAKYLKNVSLARITAEKAGYPMLVKMFLGDAALHYHQTNCLEKRNELAEQVRALNEEFPGPIQWHLF